MPNNSEPQHKFNYGGVLPNLVEMAKLGIAGIDLLLKNPPLDATNTITKGENAKMTFYTIKENDSYGTIIADICFSKKNPKNIYFYIKNYDTDKFVYIKNQHPDYPIITWAEMTGGRRRRSTKRTKRTKRRSHKNRK